MRHAVLYIVPLLLFLSSCNSWMEPAVEEEREDVVAKVGDQKLYYQDIAKLVKPGTPAQDSTQIVRNYIENWVRQKLVLKVASDQMAGNPKDLERQVQDYRESLIIYLYEKELIQQKLDTAITNSEIETYYQNAREDFFLLKTNIVRLSYVKLSLETPKRDSVRYWIEGDDPILHDKLEEYCYQYATSFFIGDSSWLLQEEVEAFFPMPSSELQWVLRQKKYREFSDSDYLYMLKVHDYRTKETVAPLSYVKEDIRKIIINKRKLSFLNDLYKKIYDDAHARGQFEIY